MHERDLEDVQVMMSMSNSPDLGALRMGDEHFEEAVKEIARHLLSQGATLAYGGDLRTQGFTRMLFDLARTYNASVPDGRTAKIINYLACTVWTKEGKREQVEKNIRREYRGAAHPICLPPPENLYNYISQEPYDPATEANAMALAAMRQTIIADSRAAVFLGGRVTGYGGKYPGVLEEIALALIKGRPLYLLGGFGGCAGDAARTLFGRSPIAPEVRRLDETYSKDYDQVIRVIRGFNDQLPENGLSLEDNTILATTSEIQTIIPLVLRGLRKVARSK